MPNWRASKATPLLLAGSAVLASHTGNTNETILATVNIPAGLMGLNDQLVIRSVWTSAFSANAKTARVRLGGIGGTAYLEYTYSTSFINDTLKHITARNSTSSQVGGAPAAPGPGTGTIALVTSAIDMTAATTLVFTGQLTNTGETISLEMYSVELWKR